MKDELLKSQMHFFALMEVLHGSLDHSYVHSFVELYLKSEYGTDYIDAYLQVYENYYYVYSSVDTLLENREEKLNDILMQVTGIIVRYFPLRNRFFLLISVLKLIRSFRAAGGDASFARTINALRRVAGRFKIPQKNYLNAEAFVLDELHRMPGKKMLLVVSSVVDFMPDVKFICREPLDGQLYFLYDDSAKVYLFFYKGKDCLELNHSPVIPRQIYVFTPGSSIKGENIQPLYYSDVVRRYLYFHEHPHIVYEAQEIAYRYPGSHHGIHPFSFTAYSGQLVAVMGGSGVGKTTLMNLLNGMTRPHQGKILVNGHDLHENHRTLTDLMGYVPQHDLLIENLTLYQNVYYNARLFHSQMSTHQIAEKVTHVLQLLNLFELRHKRVGSPAERLISGGERKRANIALELVRDPLILFLDEPTSGLSSLDADNIIHILQELTLQGKLVFINIHQPSSSIFRLFDQLILLDRGGYPVYVGNPLDALHYFYRHGGLASSDMVECKKCQTTQPESLFRIIEEQEMNEMGIPTGRRKKTPEEWYALFRKEVVFPRSETQPASLPEKTVKPHDRWRQFLIQSERNAMSKIADVSYVSLVLIVSPLLAALLAFFCRYMTKDNGTYIYRFSSNENIPAFLLMSVIVAMFVGMIMSAEELFHDRILRLREKYHGLSPISYLNAKIIYLFLLSVYHTIVFVWIGNAILEIRGMTWMFFMILLPLYFLSCLVGLIISSSLRSIVAIYIFVPILLIPEIIFSGVIVKYDKLHPLASSSRYVPVLGDLMASRWAYEALMVTQFKDNEFRKQFFDVEKAESNVTYFYYYHLPELIKAVKEWKSGPAKDNNDKRQLICNGLNYYRQVMGNVFSPSLTQISFTANEMKQLEAFLEKQLQWLKARKKALIMIRDSMYQSAMNRLGGSQQFNAFREQYTNDKITEFVLNKTGLERIRIEKNNYVPLYEPLYQEPLNNNGRSHYYAAFKKIGSFYIDTPWFNIFVLWGMAFVLYLMLLSDVFSMLGTKIYSLWKKLSYFIQQYFFLNRFGKIISKAH